jgi:hypothetical protein
VTPIPTTLATTGAWSVSNTSPAGTQLPSGTTNLPSGTYQVFANALDKAGNAKISAINTFSVVVAAPAVDAPVATSPTPEPTVAAGEPVSSLTLSSASAQASSGTIHLAFTGAVDPSPAAAPSCYSVSINGVAISVESVRVPSNTTVVLALEEGVARVGDVALVSYDIRDSKGNKLAGEVRVTAR